MGRAAVEIGAKRSLQRPVLIAIAVQLAITAATTTAKLRAGRDDTDIYFRYATMIREGNLPYRDFRVEYPPLALPLFLAPGLVSGDVMAFKIGFAAEMLMFNAATVWMVAGWVAWTQDRRQVRLRLIWYTIVYGMLSRLVVARYDAATMCVGFAAATWWSSGRRGLGGAMAGLGTLMKIYPGVIAVVAAPSDLARAGPTRGRGLAAFLATLSLGSIGWLAMGGAKGAGESLGYQLGRGFEFGSLFSGLQMLAAWAAGAEIAVVRDHAAWSSVTSWSPRLLPLVLPLQAATILIVAAVSWRRGESGGIRSFAAAILAFVITGKVFSPQYLLWLLPFMAALEGRDARRLFVLFTAGCAATLIAPALTARFPRTDIAIILAYNMKNLLFVALLALIVRRPGDTVRSEGE